MNAADALPAEPPRQAGEVRLDQSGLQILNPEECRALLAATPLGRVVFTDRALPAVEPVAFTLADGEIVIRTSRTSRLAAAIRDAIVAFEVDHFDADTSTGWSVVAVGPARLVTDTERSAYHGAPGPGVRLIRIHPEILSGRRVLGA